MPLLSLMNYLPIVGPIKTAVAPDPKNVKFQTAINTILHLFLTAISFAISRFFPEGVKWFLAAGAALSFVHYFVAAKKSCQKLVRDKIPQIMRNEGKSPVTNRASPSELSELLNTKLREEVEEFIRSKTETEKIEELADILEVVQGIANAHRLSMHQIEEARAKKCKERGGFAEGIVLAL